VFPHQLPIIRLLLPYVQQLKLYLAAQPDQLEPIAIAKLLFLKQTAAAQFTAIHEVLVMQFAAIHQAEKQPKR